MEEETRKKYERMETRKDGELKKKTLNPRWISTGVSTSVL
jgi:hypothetical protein